MPYPLNWSEQRDLFYFLPSHLQAPALFKVNTGLRESELCSLTWDMEVEIPELETTAFILSRTKNGEERLVVLNSIARDVVKSQRGKHESAVFTYGKNPLRGMENKGWRRAWRKAELPSDTMTMSGVHNFGIRLGID